MPITPSLGVGGHCIPVNPYYLLSNSSFPLLQAATEKMKHRPTEIARRILAQLSYEGKQDPAKTAQPKSRVLVVGVGFKRGQSTLSNSPALDLARALARSGQVHTLFADSLVSQAAVPDILRLRDEDWNRDTLQSFAAIIVAVKQMGLDYSILSTLEGVITENWCL
jgi:UDP-N-acetyl-D-mannosaminuronate dehydrogenase